MTLEQAVALFDAACPNTAPLALKVRWISEVDALFAASLTSRADVSFDEYDETTPADTDLLIPAPHDVVYGHYLAMQIYRSLGETVCANNAAERFNAAWYELQNRVSREFPVLHAAKWKVGDGHV